jgi:hypothetical protein
MTTIKGTKKEGAIIKHTKTWGYMVIDHKNKVDGRPSGTTHGHDLKSAEDKYNSIVNSK